MASKLSRIGLIALAAFAAIQFVRPELPISAAEDSAVPIPVKQVFQNSCYDCHSNATRLLWFDRIVPAYWLVVQDVKEGRARLNFSHFDRLTPAQRRAALFEALNQVRLGAMPPKQYTLLHPGARVTDSQIAALEQYLTVDAEQARAPAVEPADPQVPEPAAVRPAANGIAIPAGYLNWAQVSPTDRFDNHTIRAVLGNGVATAATAAHRTSPWPDGTTFAKLAWEQVPGADGTIHRGKFLQVEFMMKDAAKYKATQGWGFARWKGADLQPYGSDASFTSECTGCHAPMSDHDFVYTVVRDPLPGRFVDTTIDPRAGTISTTYDSGAGLKTVTWFERPDPNWFGARIPR